MVYLGHFDKLQVRIFSSLHYLIYF